MVAVPSSVLVCPSMMAIGAPLLKSIPPFNPKYQMLFSFWPRRRADDRTNMTSAARRTRDRIMLSVRRFTRVEGTGECRILPALRVSRGEGTAYGRAVQGDEG